MCASFRPARDGFRSGAAAPTPEVGGCAGEQDGAAAGILTRREAIHRGTAAMTTEQIERELMKLPLEERARLAERLVASLDEDAEIEAAWIDEVRRRDQELVSGAVEAIPLEDALTSIRARFGW